MPQGDVKPPRSWQDIAKQASTEEDPNKVAELARELIRTLDAKSSEILDKIKPADKNTKKSA